MTSFGMKAVRPAAAMAHRLPHAEMATGGSLSV